MSCLFPRRCPDLRDDQAGYVALLGDASRVPGVKHLFVSSGIRMDMAVDCVALVEALARRHTSGHLKVAPEHISPHVLRMMGKPAGEAFTRFVEMFEAASRRAGREQYVLPYFIAAHPGSRMEDMVDVALFLREKDIRVEQCQIFTPIPGSASCVMYATGMNPWTGEEVFVERRARRREMQKALILWHLPESRKLIAEAARIAGRPEAAARIQGGSRSRRTS